MAELKKPDHISYSQIKMARCLYKYYRMRLVKDIEEDTAAQRRGKMFHDTAAEYCRTCIDQGMDGDHDLLMMIFEKKFNEYQLAEDIFMGCRQDMVEFGERGFRLPFMLDFEKHFRITLGKDLNDKEMIFEGVIDRLDVYDFHDATCLDIIDYKGQMNILNEADVYDNMQLQLYAYACRNEYVNEYFYMRWGIYFSRYYFTRWSGLQSHVSELFDIFNNCEAFLVRQWDRIINAKQYGAERCEECFAYAGCPVMMNNECPLWSDDEVELMRSGQDIGDTVRYLRYIENETGNKKKGLTAFKEQFPIDVDGEPLRYDERTSYKYSLGDLLKYGKKYLLDFDELLVSKADVEKIIKTARKKEGDRGFNLVNLEDVEADDLISCRRETKSTVLKY